jgi:halocyanin-like protein
VFYILDMTLSRRAYLGGVATLFVATFAGCTGSPGGDPDGTTYLPTEPNYKGWFDGVSNYSRTVDARGRDAVTVEVGVQGDSGYYKFGPAAVAVTPGTTVTWRWTGRGGTHDVVSRNGLFDSGALVGKEGHTFSHTFDSPGIYYYLCTPHEPLGMKGAIFVAIE